MKEAWFETWFDTRYYHLLYRNRDDHEARAFIRALLRFLEPAAGARFLDIACGKGRHSLQLSEYGYDVTGVDLSENSIQLARQCAGTRVRFEVRDIRQPLEVGLYDVAINLFTSFGYFETRNEHLDALRNIHDSLEDNGVFVLDYFHLEYTLANLVREESTTVDDIEFTIRRERQGDRIVKTIDVLDGDQLSHFTERVMAFSSDDLGALLKEAGFIILHIFGDYALQPPSAERPRVIFIAQKQP